MKLLYELIAEALGHEYGNKITNTYLDSFDQEVVDEMHKRVIANLDL
jgi:integrase/recombinase XerD